MKRTTSVISKNKLCGTIMLQIFPAIKILLIIVAKYRAGTTYVMY